MTTNTVEPTGPSATRWTPSRLLESATDYFLWLPIGGLIALVWANAAPESYFTAAHRLAFAVNDVGMALFFALIAQEVVEAVVPGGLLHTWRRWMFPMVAAFGAFAGGAAVYLTYVQWQYEMVLAEGWPVATAIDLAFVYMLVRTIFGRHPASTFALVVAVATNAVGCVIVATRVPFLRLQFAPIALLAVAVTTAWAMRRVKTRAIWPYLVVPGPIAWWALYAMGLNPALSLVPIVPFVQHTARPALLFEDAPHSVHDSARHLEHILKYPVQIVLFLFGLVNAGVALDGYGTGTWAILVASLAGKPLGLLVGAWAASVIGLHWPRRLQWRDLGLVSMATSGGFATALFFTTALYPLGPIQGELKLGVVASGIGVLITLVLAWWSEPRAARMALPRTRPHRRKVA